jgi:cob(I)alamin adenosyltransferase
MISFRLGPAAFPPGPGQAGRGGVPQVRARPTAASRRARARGTAVASPPGSGRADRTVGTMPANRRDNPVVLSRIYTRTGDDGTTALADGTRTAKTDTRLVAYADVEEANCAIGVALALGHLPAELVTLLSRIQNELFDVGADLANPITDQPPAFPPLRIDDSYIAALEEACDTYNEGLPVLRSFVLPGGTPAAALVHTARVVTRRAERSAWAALAEHGDTVNPLTAKYLNRLSDLLFILGRTVTGDQGPVLWRPGGDR